MFKTYHKKLKDLRKTIRTSAYNRELYSKCLHSFRMEAATIKKAETLLRKVESGQDVVFPEDMAYFFTDWISSLNVRTSARKQNLLKVKLSQMAAIHVHAYLQHRIDILSDQQRLLKGLTTQEKNLIVKIEKEFLVDEHLKGNRLVPFMISMENLVIDQEETEAALTHAKDALKKLNEVAELLSNLSEIAIFQIKSGSKEGEIAFKAFSNSVDAFINLCAFKHELVRYADSRDLQLHLAALPEFMSSFVNLLVLDWTENEKIRLSLLHIRKTINVTEALLKGLNDKIAKIKSELALTSHELDAILASMNIN